MTVAAGIGVGAGGAAQSLAPATASGGANTPNPASTAGSFRSGWQSLLASLGFGDFHEAQTGTNQTPTAASALLPEEARNTSIDGAGKVVNPRATPRKGQGDVAVATVSTPAGSRSRILVPKLASGLEQPALAEATEKSETKSRVTESVTGDHAARSEKSAGDKTAAHAAAGHATTVPESTSQSLPALVSPAEPLRPSDSIKPRGLRTSDSIDPEAASPATRVVAKSDRDDLSASVGNSFLQRSSRLVENSAGCGAGGGCQRGKSCFR